MNVGIVGLGKLGFPIALAIESKGHAVYGWDASAAVQDRVRRGRFPHREEGLPELLERTRLELVPVEALVELAEIVFVAVQTPHEPSLEGSTRLPSYRLDFDYSYLTAATGSVAGAAAAQEKRLTLAVNSTVLPGTMEREIVPQLPAGVELAYNPFFTAMGTTIPDFLNPEFVLIGTDAWAREAGADSLLARFYRTLHDGPLFETDLKTAELIKVAYNTFIGQKIVFANAMMEICHKVGGNADDVEAALGLAGDRIVSPRYLGGGMGDGGPCHPRDNIALSWLSEESELSHDIFADVMRAREDQTEWLADLILERADGLPIVILGKAFKPESNLTEGSPALLLASILRERGARFTHHDGHIDGDGPPLARLSPSLFFVATRHGEYREASFPPGSVVLDPWGYIPDQEGVTVVRIGRR
jgi:UDPglucose 6-dehydrogenase